jgi:hypothetical protein
VGRLPVHQGSRLSPEHRRSVQLEHFPEKWLPVFRQKMRPIKKIRAFSGKVVTGFPSENATNQKD